MNSTMIKKLLSIALLMISMGLLSSCDSDGLGGTGMTPGAGGTSSLSDMVLHVNIPFQDQGYANIETTIITTQNELNALTEAVALQGNWDNKSNFLQSIQAKEYDFTKRNLLLFRVTESSNIRVFAPTEPVIERDKATIILDHQAVQQSEQSTVHYMIAYSVINTVEELVIRNGVERTTVTFATKDKNSLLLLSASERERLLALFDAHEEGAAGANSTRNFYRINKTALILGVGENSSRSSTPQFYRFDEELSSWYRGIRLSLIDVSNPDNPYEVHATAFEERGSTSTAFYNPKALTGLSADEQTFQIAIPVKRINTDRSESDLPPQFPAETTYVYIKIDIDRQFIELEGE